MHKYTDTLLRKIETGQVGTGHDHSEGNWVTIKSWPFSRSISWSNARRWPALVRLDRVFCNQFWDLHFGNYALHVLSYAHSNHCPLLLCKQNGPQTPTPLRFENIWTKLLSFLDVVQGAWNKLTMHIEHFHQLGHMFFSTGGLSEIGAGTSS